jgi:hypothetical protein
MIFRNYLKDPMATIAVNTTIFIAGCLFFGSIALIGIISSQSNKGKNLDIREQHIPQHFDEQAKYNEMIKLLDSIQQKLDR